MNVIQTGPKPVPESNDGLKDRFPREEFVPIGTFAGSQEFILRIRNGKPVAANTGDQGGGQN